MKDGVATGVVLVNGEEISANAVISNADPKRTLLKLVDPTHLTPDFVQKLQNYRMPGTVAKVNLALSGLPRLHRAQRPANDDALNGRIHIGRKSTTSSAPLTNRSTATSRAHPYLEATIPRLTDPSLAPAGKHVMSIYMQYAPYKLKGATGTSSGRAGRNSGQNAGAVRARLAGLIEADQIITPKDLEETYGLTGGHIFHGELALDQFFTMRPLLDWARYRTPIQNLYLCGIGTHPGAGLTGGSGANAAKEILKSLKK